jgi:hypothetical protein
MRSARPCRSPQGITTDAPWTLQPWRVGSIVAIWVRNRRRAEQATASVLPVDEQSSAAESPSTASVTLPSVEQGPPSRCRPATSATRPSSARSQAWSAAAGAGTGPPGSWSQTARWTGLLTVW